MLKKMRWRFIWSAMGAFSAVIVLFAVVINLVNYSIVTNREDQVIDGIFHFEEEQSEEDRESSFPVFEYPGGERPEFEHTTRFFMIRYDSEGETEELSTEFIASVSEDEVVNMGKEVLNNGHTSGMYQNYRYHIYDSGEGKLLIFLDISPEKEFNRTLMLITLILVISGLVIVFVLIFLLSRRAIVPYVRNMERQKQFITDAGHELKTPLTSISASTDVLKLEYGEDEWICNIQKQTARLSKLVANLITLSRLDESEGIPEKEDFSLSEAAWETVEPFASLAQARGKSFSQNIEEDLWMRGERAGIQQMISVLLDNAIRYSDEKGSISFSVYQERDRKFLEVENTCELDENIDLERLFDRFYRPDGSRSKKTGGFGIGLSIAQAIAEAHDGKIEVNVPEKGRIRFTVTLK